MVEKGEHLSTPKEQIAVVLMGSPRDAKTEHCQKIFETLEEFGVTYHKRFGSAHRTPQHNSEMADMYLSSQDKHEYFFITVAGLSNALSGFTKGALATANPPISVIACPPPSEVDAPSSFRMPKGVVVGYYPDPANAALKVVEEFSKNNPELAEKYISYLKELAMNVVKADIEISRSYDKQFWSTPNLHGHPGADEGAYGNPHTDPTYGDPNGSY